MEAFGITQLESVPLVCLFLNKAWITRLVLCNWFQSILFFCRSNLFIFKNTDNVPCRWLLILQWPHVNSCTLLHDVLLLFTHVPDATGELVMTGVAFSIFFTINMYYTYLTSVAFEHWAHCVLWVTSVRYICYIYIYIYIYTYIYIYRYKPRI